MSDACDAGWCFSSSCWENLLARIRRFQLGFARDFHANGEGQVGQGLELPGIVEGAPGHGRGWNGMSLRFLPAQSILGLLDNDVVRAAQ